MSSNAFSLISFDDLLLQNSSFSFEKLCIPKEILVTPESFKAEISSGLTSSGLHSKVISTSSCSFAV